MLTVSYFKEKKAYSGYMTGCLLVNQWLYT